jgi:tripartite-type tricarboxylate transporter receptor subunit TctC
MKLPRRTLLRFAVATVAAPAVSRVAAASVGPGKVLDDDSLPIGIGRAARARPDGYTIDLGILSTHVLNGAFYSLPYDLLNDFVPIVPLARSALMLFGRRGLPVKDLRELIEYLKANPTKVTAAAQIVSLRLLATYFQQQAGTHLTLVPYRGSAPALQDLLAGQIDLLFDTPSNSLPHVRAGSINAYAVTSDKRLTLASDVPTFAEMGLPALSYTERLGSFAPKGTPPFRTTGHAWRGLPPLCSGPMSSATPPGWQPCAKRIP